jgi:DNA modification methylase
MEPYYNISDIRNKILQGDVIDQLKLIPDESIHCVITSPPYWGLRQYFFEGAVCLKGDLTEEKKEYVLKELNIYKVNPKHDRKKQ